MFSEYCQQYNKSISIADEMEQEIVQFISEYDKKLKKEEKILKHTAQSNIGGWVTVTRKYVYFKLTEIYCSY